MKYRFTPGIIFCGLLCFFSLYLLVVSGDEIAAYTLLIFALVVLIADFFLQCILKNNTWLWTIESIIILAIIVLNTKFGN